MTALEVAQAAVRKAVFGDAPQPFARAPNETKPIRQQSPMDLIESILRSQSQCLDALSPDSPALPHARTAQQLAFALKHHLEGRSTGGR